MKTTAQSWATGARMKGVALIIASIILSPCWAAAQPSISSGGVASASAFGGFTSVAPGSWIEIYGSNLATDTRSWTTSDFNGVNAPTALDGTSVTIGGKPAFIDYISPGQVDAQVPSNALTGPQPIVVSTNNVASNPYTVTINADEPGLLATPAFDIGGTQYVVALFPDGVTYALPPGAIAGVPSRRAVPGDTITLYGIGFGPVIPSIPAGQIVQQQNSLASQFQVMFGQTSASVTYDGLAPNVVGLYQFDVVVPNVPSSDTTPLTFTVDGVAGTQTLYLSIQGGNSGAQAQSLTLSPTSVSGGGTAQGTVTISQPAPAGGAVVALSSNSNVAIVPATATVSEGATSITFNISTIAVQSNQIATIMASYGGNSVQSTLTVTPSGGTLPQFTALGISANLTLSSGAAVKFAITLASDPDLGVTSCELNGGWNTNAGSYMFLAGWGSFVISGSTLACGNFTAVGTEIIDPTGDIAEFSSGTLIFTLTPQVVNTSGTVSGTVNLVSTIANVSGSFTGTYIIEN